MKILRLPLQPSSPELFHPPGLFKIDKLTNRHWFKDFSVSLNQIQAPKPIESKKKFGGQKFEKIPLKKIEPKLFV